MAEPLADKIMRKVKQLNELYHRLMLVVAPSGAGKTTALLDVRDRTGAPLINVNLDLSRLMLDLTQRQRTLLDNIELIFDVGLKQDPLRLLQGLSRNKTVVASWNGAIIDGFLTYAEPSHPEFRRYPVHDFVVTSPEMTT